MKHIKDIAQVEDKIEKVKELFKDNSITPTAYEQDHFDNFDTKIKNFKIDIQNGRSFNDQDIADIRLICTDINEELDKMIDDNRLFKQ